MKLKAKPQLLRSCFLERVNATTARTKGKESFMSPMKYEPFALSLSKGFVKRNPNGTLDFFGPVIFGFFPNAAQQNLTS
jgi:hypothetical protein